jgi:hypothetical protein
LGSPADDVLDEARLNSFYRLGAQLYGPNPLMASVTIRSAADGSAQDAYFSLAAFC